MRGSDAGLSGDRHYFRDSSKLGGVEVEIVGRLTALLGEKAYPTGVRGVWGKMVAEERIRRNHPFLQIEV